MLSIMILNLLLFDKFVIELFLILQLMRIRILLPPYPLILENLLILLDTFFHLFLHVFLHSLLCFFLSQLHSPLIQWLRIPRQMLLNQAQGYRISNPKLSHLFHFIIKLLPSILLPPMILSHPVVIM